MNDCPLTSLSDKPNDLAVITRLSFLGQGLAINTSLSAFHNRGERRRDLIYNTTLAHKFWHCWMRSYLSTSQGRTKSRVTRNNICTGKLVLVGYAEDISKRGTYCLGRVHRVCRKGKELVRSIRVAYEFSRHFLSIIAPFI